MPLLGLPLELLLWIGKSIDKKDLRSLRLISRESNVVFTKSLFDCIDFQDTPPIHWAIESVKIVERLLNIQNIDLNNQSLDGNAPISIALTCRQTYIFQLLLSDERTNFNICDHHGQTPLHLATEIGDYGAIHMLVRNPRVDANCLNHRQETPLLLAVKGHGRFLPINKRILIIEALLLSPCINLNYQDENGRTAIWYVVNNSDTKLAELLLQQTDLDLNCADKLG
ncbi:hypothetical protein N7517_011704 [Penicillium concentricum]|uniref:F-box domain-containing protein n=1 Tax=Penicillium concentricum TaxID=293559 RepID=A0A9W9RBA6_9EURO|nr:uncharacterized protein N7517_011704 [Penicillium concentricum]KAJ5357095.1 hypothetical protein N7517_011704 [Penicillium concentricum]